MENEPNKKITAFYCRSAIKNDEAIENQKEKLTDYAQSRNIEKYEFYIDNGASGTTLDRPALKQLLENVKKGIISTVAITEYCRLSRNCLDCLELESIFDEHHVNLIEITNDNPHAITKA